ncbi:YdhK family protein [Clostridium arbusti]|uniref:YdhK family protein n=1 Tax=Clostridium arbusti TaxID=1137848 RepID=UPI000288B361|nr:YdhK family protein [Clostridium arbusti]
MKKIIMVVTSLMLVLVLSACSSSTSKHSESMTSVDNLTKEKNAAYTVGTSVIINTDHMKGMKGAKGTVSGVYKTTVYAIDYTPSDGGTEVKNHRWVIKEELEDSSSENYAVGDELTLKSGHMSGMGGKGVKAKIVQVVEGPAYMVDYKPTDGSKEVKNHQWVIESELQPAK